MKFDFPAPGRGYSLHNHSNWSDGSSTIEEMCRAAKAAGLKVFGLSDHWVVPPMEGTDSKEWSMDLDKLDLYVETLQKLKNELNDENFTLKTGLEVDFFFENIDDVMAELEQYPLDYLIGSVHYAGTFPLDYCKENWEELSEEEIAALCTIYWNKLAGAAEYGKFLFLGHLDLLKKFGFYRHPENYASSVLQVLDAAAATGTGIELNTSGWFKPCQVQYPSLAILKEANARRIPVVITPDAHDCAHVNRNFEEAEAVLKEAGFCR